jgi:hypothetical protein
LYFYPVIDQEPANSEIGQAAGGDIDDTGKEEDGVIPV